MNNPLHLLPGSRYRVIQAFTDYDGLVHPAGETRTLVRTGFLPYEDDLTLQVQPVPSRTGSGGGRNNRLT